MNSAHIRLISVTICISLLAFYPVNGLASFSSTSPLSKLKTTSSPVELSGIRPPAPVKGNRIAKAPLVSTKTAGEILSSPSTTQQYSAGQQSSAATALTPEITELARGLRHDPLLIYEFVRNTIDYIPVFGGLKGAAMTLLDGRGNDFDQASLLIALLRASGYAANYIYGTIRLDAAQITSWLGVADDPSIAGSILASGGIPADVYTDGAGHIAYIELNHVFVKVTIDSENYVFDPSFKAHTAKTGINLDSALQYDKAIFLSQATQGMTSGSGFVQAVNRSNIRNSLSAMTNTLVTHIRTHMPGAGMDDIIGGKQIEAIKNKPFEITLPYETARLDEWTGIPDSYNTTLRIQHLGIDIKLTVAQFYGKRLTIAYGFEDGYYYPYLLLDGVAIAAGNPTSTSNYLACDFTIDHPYSASGGSYCDETGTVYLRPGYIYYISNGWGGVGRKVIEKHRRILDQFLAEGISNLSEAVLGESLTMIGLTWMAETTKAGLLGDTLSKTLTLLHHELGVVGQESAPFMDMPMSQVSIISLDGIEDRTQARMYARSGINSAFEWGAIDQVQETSAVSTIKLLDMANAQGDKIYDADSSNYTTFVKPNLKNYSAYQLSLVTSYISSGYRVILSENGNIRDVNYKGVGFIAISPYGGMANMIAGGLTSGSGGYSNTFGLCEADRVAAEMAEYNKSAAHPKSEEPIDLVTGYYLDHKADLTVGGDQLPLGLSFLRSYSSEYRFNSGPLGRGWRHGWDLSAKTASDGFCGMGEGSPVEAAPAIAGLYVADSILMTDGHQLDRLAIATIAHRWFTDNLIDNMTNINIPGDTLQFRKMPDSTYASPPAECAQLVKSVDHFLLTTRSGDRVDFDAQGKLLTWKDADDNMITLGYLGDRLISISNDLGRSLSIGYDVDNRISSISDGNGRSVSYIYDTSGNLVRSTDPELNETLYEYDAPGRLTKIFKPADPSSPFVVNTYDAFDRVSTQEDDAGGLYTYYYAGTRTEEIDPPGNSTVYYFDRKGRTVLTVDALSFETAFEYDGPGRLVKKTFPEGNGMEYEYDACHNRIVTRLLPKPGMGEPPVETFSSYTGPFNRKTSATDPLGNTTRYFYDAKGNLTRIELPEVDGVVPTYHFTANSRGQVLNTTGPLGMKKDYLYDPLTGDLISATVDQGGLDIRTLYEYDPIGNLTKITDADGHERTFLYDGNRRVIKETLPFPVSGDTFYGYDPDGNRNLVSMETGNPLYPLRTSTGTYTPRGGKKTVTDPESHTSVYQYGPMGRLTGFIDPETRITEYIYDELGRPLQQKNPLGTVIEEHTYTPNGLKNSLTDAGSNETFFHYDAFDRLFRTVFADGSVSETTYDQASNPTQKLTRSGSMISYTYDALNRMKSKTLPGPFTSTFTYDRLGRLSEISEPDGTTAMTYDPAGRLTSILFPDGKTIGYTYDAEGNRTKIIYPDGFFVVYTYDELNRMEKIYENGTLLLAQYSYDALSRRVQVFYQNGASVDYAYSQDNHITGMNHHFPGETVNFSYEYDQVGNLIRLTAGNDDFDYSPGMDSTAAYTVNALNQYDSVNGTDYIYDLNGNLISDDKSSYLFNAENNLTSVSTGSKSVSYVYNALGHPAKKTVDGETAFRVYDGLQMIMEYNALGSPVKHFVYGPFPDEPIMMKKGAARYFYHPDRTGSVIALSDQSGMRVETYAYSPYGIPETVSSIGNPFLWNAKEYDQTTGLYYFNARYYHPADGRFISPDPIGQSGGSLNLYAYVSNNPVNLKDPLGLCPNPKFNTYDYDISEAHSGIEKLKIAYQIDDRFKQSEFGNDPGVWINKDSCVDASERRAELIARLLQENTEYGSWEIGTLTMFSGAHTMNVITYRSYDGEVVSSWGTDNYVGGGSIFPVSVNESVEITNITSNKGPIVTGSDKGDIYVKRTESSAANFIVSHGISVKTSGSYNVQEKLPPVQ